MTDSDGTAPRVLRAGEHAVLVEYADTETVLQVAAALQELEAPCLREVVPAERTLLLNGTALSTPKELAQLLTDLPHVSADAMSAQDVVIPVVYDGEDLEEVSGLLGLTPSALVEAHTETAWTAAFGGFAPGFAYLLPASEDEGWRWDVPRRSEPRTAVPTGSVALAARYGGIYPRSSPGGWQLVGRTDAVLFDASRRQPALLTPGTRVRFEARRATAAAARRSSNNLPGLQGLQGLPGLLGRHSRSGGSTRFPGPTAARPALTVLASGPLALVEDGGRPGRAAIGVSRSGAFDRGALMRANLAVGNPAFAPGIELLVGPMHLRVEAPTVLAIAGAAAPVVVTRLEEDSGHLELTAEDAAGYPIALDPGDRVEIGPVSRGLRVLVAVRGGVAVPRELGSASRDTLSALGPEPLAAGDTVSVGPEHGLDAVPWRPAPEAGAGGEEQGEQEDAAVPVRLPITLGPRHAALGEAAVKALLGQTWTVRADSDRIGVRLEAEPIPVPEGASSLPSEPMVPGAIQVPPSGLPVVFGPDHPATGGYPVIGVLTDAGFDMVAQLSPGSLVRFEVERS